MDIFIENKSMGLFFARIIDTEPFDNAENINKTASNIKNLRYLAEQLLMDWLDSPPTERRQLQALNLLVDAVQSLNSACINLGVIIIPDNEEQL
jgi:hypothetical protein